MDLMGEAKQLRKEIRRIAEDYDEEKKPHGNEEAESEEDAVGEGSDERGDAPERQRA